MTEIDPAKVFFSRATKESLNELFPRAGFRAFASWLGMSMEISRDEAGVLLDELGLRLDSRCTYHQFENDVVMGLFEVRPNRTGETGHTCERFIVVDDKGA